MFKSWGRNALPFLLGFGLMAPWNVLLNSLRFYGRQLDAPIPYWGAVAFNTPQLPAQLLFLYFGTSLTSLSVAFLVQSSILFALPFLALAGVSPFLSAVFASGAALTAMESSLFSACAQLGPNASASLQAVMLGEAAAAVTASLVAMGMHAAAGTGYLSRLFTFYFIGTGCVVFACAIFSRWLGREPPSVEPLHAHLRDGSSVGGSVHSRSSSFASRGRSRDSSESETTSLLGGTSHGGYKPSYRGVGVVAAASSQSVAQLAAPHHEEERTTNDSSGDSLRSVSAEVFSSLVFAVAPPKDIEAAAVEVSDPPLFTAAEDSSRSVSVSDPPHPAWDGGEVVKPASDSVDKPLDPLVAPLSRLHHALATARTLLGCSWRTCFAVWLNMVILFSVYPGVISDVPFGGTTSYFASDSSRGWTLTLLLLFAVFDLAGRQLAGLKVGGFIEFKNVHKSDAKRNSRIVSWLLKLTLSRVVWLPVFVVVAGGWRPPGVDALVVLNMIGFALSNGHATTLIMVVGPQLAPAELRGPCAILHLSCLILGLWSGSLLALGLQGVVSRA